MWPGMKEGELKIFNYLHILRHKRSGFSLIELAIASLILLVISACLFMTLNIGQLSFPVISTKIEVQSKVRLAMDWILKDLRQAISWNIASDPNNPTVDHLKFNLWTWNSVTNTWDLSNSYIEYIYDANSKTLTRTRVENGQTMVLEFSDLDDSPFYTTYVVVNDPSNVLEAVQLRNNRKLIIVLKGLKNVRGTLNVPFNLKAEVKIRNG